VVGLAVLAFACGQKAVRFFFKRSVLGIFRAKAQKWKRNPPGSYVPQEDVLKEDLAQILGGSSTPDEIDGIVRDVMGMPQ
jgi:hypothetical protein